MKKRGRPAGSVVRWTPEWDRDVWARVEAICEHTGLGLVAACRRLAYAGYIQVMRDFGPAAGGKAWVTRPPAPDDPAWVHTIFDQLRAGALRRGDARNDPARCAIRGPEQTFYSRYYKAVERMDSDPIYHAECLFWKRVYLRVLRGEDPVQAFLDETPPTC